MINYDLQLQNNDLVINNGDFAIAESDSQHIVDTLNAFPGWWKNNPQDGVGLMQYMKGSANVPELNRSIKVNLESDGYRCEAPVINLDVNGNLVINPNAVKI